MAETFYIDCNRLNSIRSDDNSNEWEFDLGEEALRLPKGSEVAVQESFINKKGVSGNSIIIDEDIETSIHYGFYEIHNPHHVPFGKTRDLGIFANNLELYDEQLQAVNQTGVGSTQTVNIDMDGSYTFRNTTDVGAEKINTIHPNNLPEGLDFRDAGGLNLALPICEVVGGAEERLAGNFADPDGVPNCDGFLKPFFRETKIFIPAGEYGVSEIAQLIEDQLNGRKMADRIKVGDFNTDFHEQTKEAGSFVADLSNGGTYQRVKPTPANIQKADNTTARTDNDNLDNRNAGIPDNNTFNYYVGRGRALEWFVNETGTIPIDFLGSANNSQFGHNEKIPSYTREQMVFMLGTMRDFNDCWDTWKRTTEWEDIETDTNNPIYVAGNVFPKKNIENWIKRSDSWRWSNLTAGSLIDPDGLVPEGFSSNANYPNSAPNNIAPNGNQNGRRGWAFWATRREMLENAKPNKSLFGFKRCIDSHPNQMDIHQFLYDTQQQAVYIGAPQITLTYNNTASAFSLGGLHSPFKLPSHDTYGNSNGSNAGQEVALFKRLAQEKRETHSAGTPIDKQIIAQIDDPYSRTGGIFVYNWDDTIAKKEGDVNVNGVYNPAHTNMLRYNDYFSSERKAEQAWKKSLWGRLGFTYAQFNEGFEYHSFGNNGDKQRHTLYGTTTRQEVNSAIASTISSTFNGSDFKDPEDAETVLRPRVFGNIGINTTLKQASVNTQGTRYDGQVEINGNEMDNVPMYETSLFNQTTTVPAITTARPINASQLPVLSSNGYYIITSNIIDGYNDRIKKGKPIPIMGVVPISNLSSQDYIQTRNQMVHIIQNDKVLNSIKFKILNPDLTNPELEENSSVILRITIPLMNPNVSSALEHKAEVDKKKEQEEKVEDIQDKTMSGGNKNIK